MRGSQTSKIIAAVALTAVTVGVIGVVLVAMTPIGCGPTKALGMKSISNRCAKPVAAASPYPSAKPGYKPGYYPPPSSDPPYNPPYKPPVTPPYPPYNPPATAPINPDGTPASPAYPPYFPPASGSNGMIPAMNLSCRLPVHVGQPGSGGFIVFPGGTFVADPASAVSLPGVAATPPPRMGQPNWSWLSYDKAFSKWLPVPLSWVSPDGSRYAFPSTNSIWVHNVADGTHVLLGEGQPWTVVAFLSEGVYASAADSGGLWLLPLSGAPRQIATIGFWRAAAAGAAYGTPTSAVPQGASTGILKLDLKTGAVTDWFSRPNSQATVLGFDAQGYPIVQLFFQAQTGTRAEIWLSTGPSTGVLLAGSPGAYYYYGPSLQGPPVADSHGIWFQAYLQYAPAPYSNSGMVMYMPGSGMYWMSNINAMLAGGCS